MPVACSEAWQHIYPRYVSARVLDASIPSIRGRDSVGRYDTGTGGGVRHSLPTPPPCWQKYTVLIFVLCFFVRYTQWWPAGHWRPANICATQVGQRCRDCGVISSRCPTYRGSDRSHGGPDSRDGPVRGDAGFGNTAPQVDEVNNSQGVCGDVRNPPRVVVPGGRVRPHSRLEETPPQGANYGH